MASNQLVLAFIISILLYMVGALSSLITYRNPKLCNTLSNTFSLIASTSLTIIMLYKIIFLNSNNLHFGVGTNTPFLSLNFNIDNLSAFFILIIGLVSALVSLFSFTYMSHYFYVRNILLFGSFYNIFILSMILLVASSNLILFLIFWELMSLVSYLLVIFEHEKEEVQKAGRTYIIMTYIGTAFITAAFVLIASFTKSFDLSVIQSTSIPANFSNIIYILLFIGFGTKAGIIPMHVWLPYAHPVAPSNVSALMSGLMIKMSIYGLLRIIFDVTPNISIWLGIATLFIGSISAVFGIAYSVASTTNIKRLLAYSSIENMGIIFCGLGMVLVANASGNKFLLSLSLTATMLHVLNHAVFKSLLFMGAGAVQYSAHTKNMEKLGGLIKKMPIASAFIFAGCLAISAVPPFNGFISEYMVFQTIINNIIWFSPLGEFSLVIVFMIVAMALSLTGALAAYCFVKFFGISFLGMPRSKEAESATEPGKPMLTALGISAVLCVLFGIFPKYMISFIDNVSINLIDLKLLSTDWKLSGISYYPFKNNTFNLSMALFTLFLLIFAGLVFLAVTVIRKHTSVRKYNTWDCGFTSINPKMQYSATGFSKSISIVFRGFFKPGRRLVITEGRAPYTIKKGIYTVTTTKLIEKYIYAPFTRRIINFSRKFRFTIQTGSVHTYLIYFFGMLVAMLLYYAIFNS